MADRAQARRGLAAALLSMAPLLAGCSGGVPPAETAGLDAWAQGPARWLILPEEAREMKHLGTSREAIAFMERFWRRRDPDPSTPGNLFMQAFHERVEAADALYAEPGVRGSLTDRGRALVLLGPPPVLRYNQRAIPGRDPGRGAFLRPETAHIVVETWTYPAEELGPELVAELPEGEGEIVLLFVVEPRRTYLIEGERYLAMAARAAVHDDE